uniref:Uncharacterized protein n=1 Tax=Strigamia maritima TaxID=126957 RepID=T1J210_STRMM
MIKYQNAPIPASSAAFSNDEKECDGCDIVYIGPENAETWKGKGEVIEVLFLTRPLPSTNQQLAIAVPDKETSSSRHVLI